MPMRAIVPPEYREAVRKSKISPGLLAGDYLFLTGMTGSGPGGLMPAEPEAQFRQAFAKIGAVLAEAGLDFRALVEMTSYHVGLRDHFALFDAIRLDHVNEPYPAWTAVEVAGLRREGAIVEIRAIAWSGREG